MDLFTFVTIGLFLGIHVLFEFLHYRREERLMNRIMAKDLREFEYYDKRYTKDLKELGKLREEQREERKAEAEAEGFPVQPEDKIENFDGDWVDEEQ